MATSHSGDTFAAKAGKTEFLMDDHRSTKKKIGTYLDLDLLWRKPTRAKSLHRRSNNELEGKRGWGD